MTIWTLNEELWSAGDMYVRSLVKASTSAVAKDVVRMMWKNLSR